MAVTPVITENSEINPTYLTPNEYTRILAVVNTVEANPNKYKGIFDYSVYNTLVPADVYANWENGAFFYSALDSVFYVLEKENNQFIATGAPSFTGEYDSNTRYFEDQLVTYEGQLYWNKQCGTTNAGGVGYTENVLPTDTSCWLPVTLDTGGGSGGSTGSGGSGGGAITVDESRNYKGSLSELPVTTGTDNIALGFNALQADVTGSNNIALGYNALQANIDGENNIAIGNLALQNMLYSGNNVAIGFNALPNFRSSGAVAIGDSAGYVNKYGYNSTFIGSNSGYQNDTGRGNTAVGSYAGYSNQESHYNTAVGGYAGAYNLGDYNTHLGFQAGNGYSSDTYYYSYNTAIGAYSLCTGSNQVQLGGSGTTTYVHGTVQNRSDIRDKADVVDTTLGIAFITGLRAVEGVWDHRDDYYTESEVVNKDGKVEIVRIPAIKDGSKKRNRKHQWFIAQEVKELCDRLGVDFGGYQDHSINGGADVLSLGYDEFIPPAVKAIQECWQRLDKLEERISKLEQ